MARKQRFGEVAHMTGRNGKVALCSAPITDGQWTIGVYQDGDRDQGDLERRAKARVPVCTDCANAYLEGVTGWETDYGLCSCEHADHEPDGQWSPGHPHVRRALCADITADSLVKASSGVQFGTCAFCATHHAISAREGLAAMTVAAEAMA